jgi:cytochrome c6
MKRPASWSWPAGLAAMLIAVGQSAGAADIYNGKDVYELHCQTCHGVDGQSMEPGIPDFTRGESLMVPDAQLFEELWDGMRHMPSYRGMMDDSDLRDVIAYLRTLQR